MGLFLCRGSGYLRNGFIACPSGAEVLISSINSLNFHDVIAVNVEELDFPLYYESSKPVLVTCQWLRPCNEDGTIPSSIAVPLMIEKQTTSWINSFYPETWETMRPYILGRPHGARSSLFVDSETGQALKKMWQAMMQTGGWGLIHS